MVLKSPEERAALDVKARTLGVSAGEVVHAPFRPSSSVPKKRRRSR